ncbi:hypothetical protein LZ31DRAFT_560229 [Colletotrichum somersetense]|nr:hypothetical protein LZ31DRAFT_560229 [Colletotrichum somersetense]
MDAIPIYHDIAAVPASIVHHHGDFLTAVPSYRSMHRATLLLRAASLFAASAILGLVSFAQQRDGGAAGDDLALGSLTYGTPTAVFAWVWSAVDVAALLGRARGPPRKPRFGWGRPGSHVAAHLLIWAPTMAFIGLLLADWWAYAHSPGWALHRLNLTAGLIFSMFVLM